MYPSYLLVREKLAIDMLFESQGRLPQMQRVMNRECVAEVPCTEMAMWILFRPLKAKIGLTQSSKAKLHLGAHVKILHSSYLWRCLLLGRGLAS